MSKSKTQKKLTGLYIDPKIHRRLKTLAAERETTFTAVIQEAFELYLRKVDKKKRARK